jgi:hypothetical protein
VECGGRYGLCRPLTDELDFFVREGTHLNGRQKLAVFTQQLRQKIAVEWHSTS